MAATVVPSRARAARQAPPSNDVTYVKMNLMVDQIQGDLQPEPKHYFFRWIRAGKQLKVTAAKPANASPFAEKMALYAKVRRHGPVFVSNDPSEPLDTQLVLVMTESDGNPTIVSTVAFDIAYYLDAIVESGTKTLATTVQMPGSITISITLSIKAIGDDHLHRYVPDRQLGLNASASSDMDEAAAALELAGLRQRVRENDNRIDALEQSTDSLQNVVRRAQPADSNVQPGTQSRIKELEEKLSASEHENSEAQRRIQAHMAHAKKIRETYERLAVWYNDLRQEHSELRKKVENRSVDSSDSADRTIVAAGSSQGTNVENLRAERDKLHAELQEHSEVQSRNSQLLETKAHALAELRNQWDSAQNSLQSMKQENEEKNRGLEELRQTVDSLRSQLLERSATLEERESELEETNKEIQAIHETHAEALERVKAESTVQSRSVAESELNQLRAQQQEELQRLNETMKAEMAAKLEAEREQLNTEKEKEIEALRKETREKYELDKSAEVASLTASRDVATKEETDKYETRVAELENIAKASDDAALAAQEEKSALQSQLDALKSEYESKLAEKEKTTEELREGHARELQNATLRKDEVERELVSVQSAQAAVAGNLQGEQRLKESKLQADYARLQEELDHLRKENEEMRSSPRTISSTAERNETEQIAERLNSQIGELKSLLKAETEKRSETAKLLASSDREHDELREMVTRLRSERDGALHELKRAKDAVPNPEIRHASVQRSVSHEGRALDAASAEQERDQAMRELFRVRKTMNKEIRRLKKENQELSEQSTNVTADREVPTTVAQLTEERDNARFDVQRAQNELEAAKRSLSAEQESSGTLSKRTDELRNRLQLTEEELNTMRTTVKELQESLAGSRKEKADGTAILISEKENLLSELNSSKSAKRALEAALREKEEEAATLRDELDSKARGLAEATKGGEEISRERDSARNKSAALATELGALKESLNAMSSSTSSAETMLREAQKEVAESKAEVNLLRSELADLRTELEMKEQRLVKESSSFETSMSQQRSLFANERVARDELMVKTSELEGLVASLHSKNDTISTKLNMEQNMKEDAEKRAADYEKNLNRLREELSQVRSNELASAEAVGRASAEREQTNKSLTDATHRVQSLEQSLGHKNAEVLDLQEKIGVAGAESESLRSELRKISDDGKTVRQELLAVRSELAQVQNELKQKSLQLESETAKGLEISQQETAAVRDLTGLSENLRAENAKMRSRLESTQNELRVMKEEYSKVQADVQSMEREAAARERSTSDYNRLKEAHAQLKEDMSRASQECSRIRNDKSTLEKEVRSMQQTVDSLQHQMVAIRDENEEKLTAERANSEREGARVTEMRKELRSARAAVESRQAEIDQMREENAKLSKEKGEAPDSHVLDELINTRIELAYAQEEAVRLRNKLKKVSPKGSGSASFEY